VAQPEKALNLAPIALQPNQARSPDQFCERASVRSDENQNTLDLSNANSRRPRRPGPLVRQNRVRRREGKLHQDINAYLANAHPVQGLRADIRRNELSAPVSRLPGYSFYR
jgi:hypothetical protein